MTKDATVKHAISAAPAPDTSEITETASPRLSIAALPPLDLKNLPARLDDTMLAAVEQVARLLIPALPPCGDRHFLQCLRIMQAALPRRSPDDLGGELLAGAYQRMLGQFPDAAISFLTEEALRSCQWFPTIVECEAILLRWKRADEAVNRRNAAKHAVRSELQQRMDEALADIAADRLSQPQLDGLPETVKRIAAERCLLWHHPDGSFTRRRPGGPLPEHLRSDRPDDNATPPGGGAGQSPLRAELAQLESDIAGDPAFCAASGYAVMIDRIRQRCTDPALLDLCTRLSHALQQEVL